MKLKTKMLKNLISVLCAATVATSTVAGSVSAAHLPAGVTQDQFAQKKVELQNKYSEISSIYGEVSAQILKGKCLLGNEEEKLARFEMHFISLANMCDKIEKDENYELVLSAINKADQLKKDIVVLWSKSEGIELTQKLDNFRIMFYGMAIWIKNNQLVDEVKDTRIVHEIAKIGVKFKELEKDYEEVLNGKETIGANRYKKLIEEGDRLIARIDSFKKSSGLGNMMATAEMVYTLKSTLKNSVKRRFNETMSNIRYRVMDNLGTMISETESEINKIDAQFMDLYSKNESIFAAIDKRQQERKNENQRIAADRMFSRINQKTNSIKKYAMNKIRSNDLSERIIEKMNALDKKLSDKVKDVKEDAMNKIKSNDAGLKKKAVTNDLNTALSGAVTGSKKYTMDKIKNRVAGEKKKAATNDLNTALSGAFAGSRKYAMDKIKNRVAGEKKKAATEQLAAGVVSKNRGSVLDELSRLYRETKLAKENEKKSRELLAKMDQDYAQTQGLQPEQIVEDEPTVKKLSEREKKCISRATEQQLKDLINLAYGSNSNRSASETHETENNLKSKYDENLDKMERKKKEVKEWIGKRPEEQREDTTDVNGFVVKEGLWSRYNRILDDAKKGLRCRNLSLKDCIGISDRVISELDSLMNLNKSLGAIEEANLD